MVTCEGAVFKPGGVTLAWIGERCLDVPCVTASEKRAAHKGSSCLLRTQQMDAATLYTIISELMQRAARVSYHRAYPRFDITRLAFSAVADGTPS